MDLVNQVQQDKKDGDVDIQIKIAPNTEEDEVNIDFESIGIDEVLAHIKSRDLTVPRKRGIGGCHDMNEFYSLHHELEGYNIPEDKKLDSDDVPEIIIRSKTPHASVPGVYLIVYGIPALNVKQETSGEVKWIRDPKTVYDPEEWTDEKLKQALREAITDAASRNSGNIPSTNPTEGTTSSGHKIVYTFREGKVTSFWFA